MRPLEPYADSESLVADAMCVDFEPTPSGCQTTIAPSSVGATVSRPGRLQGPGPSASAAFAALLGV